MGYQESYVTIATGERFTKQRFDKLVKRIREVGKDYYESYGAIPVEIITFNKANEFFKKGQKAIYFVGDRYLQRDLTTVLRYATEDDYPDEMWNKDPIETEINVNMELDELDKYHAQIIFTEYVDAAGVWPDAGKPLYVTHEQFEWDDKNNLIQ